VGLNTLKSLNLTNGYPNNKNNNKNNKNNIVKSKPLELRSRVKMAFFCTFCDSWYDPFRSCMFFSLRYSKQWHILMQMVILDMPSNKALALVPRFTEEC
jgi:hypothetical protein